MSRMTPNDNKTDDEQELLDISDYEELRLMRVFFSEISTSSPLASSILTLPTTAPQSTNPQTGIESSASVIISRSLYATKYHVDQKKAGNTKLPPSW